MNAEEVLECRIKRPNCMYCQFINTDRYILYYCNKKQKSFLVGNRYKARRCPYYNPKVDDLELAASVVNQLEEEYGVRNVI